MSTEQIGKDLAKHLYQRIDSAIEDYFDRCSTMHVSKDQAVALALTHLSCFTVMVAAEVEATETEFVTMCRWHFHQMKQVGS